MKNGLGLEVVSTDRDVEAHETLVWNTDGFCWLRGVGGAERAFQGRFSSLPEAFQAAKAQGLTPTAVFHYDGDKTP